MNDRNKVNEIYRRLVAAPCELDCKTSEVLAALGQFVSALLTEGWRDQTERRDTANRFCAILQACVSPTQSTRPLH